MTLIKAGSYAGAIMAIGSLLVVGYESNAWSADVEAMSRSSQQQMLGMEKRMLTRQIMEWSTKPANTAQERQYKNAVLEQLRSDKQETAVKLRSLND